MVVDPLNGLAFITEGNQCGVRVVNMTSMKAVAWVNTTCSPGTILFDPADAHIYVGIWESYRPCISPGQVQVIDATSFKVIRNLSVGSDVEGLAYDPVTMSVVVAASDAGLGAYCSSTASYLVSFNGTSLTPSYNRSVPRLYSSLTYDGANGELVATGGGKIDFYNASTGLYLSNSTLGGFPGQGPVEGILYVNQTRDLYLSDLGDSQLVVLSGTNGSVLGRYTEWSNFGGGIGYQQPPIPFEELSYDPHAGLVYATSLTFNEVFRFNVSLGKFVEPLIVQFTPMDLLGDPSGSRVFVGGSSPQADVVFNATTFGVADPFNVTFAPATSNCGLFDPSLTAFTECVGGAVGVVYERNGSANTSGAYMGNDQSGIAWDSKDSEIWTSDPSWPRGYFVHDSNLTNGSSIALGANTSGVAYFPARNEVVFIAAGDVLAFGATNHSSVYNVSVGGMLANEAIDADNGTLYFTNSSTAGHWFVAWNLSKRSVDYSIPISGGATAIVLATPLGRAYVLNAPADNVSVINLTSQKLLGTISVGSYPASGLYERALGRLLVANQGSESISIIDVPHPFPVWFNETGLPRGTSWSVRMNGHSALGNTSTLILEVNNGTYSYSIGPVRGYAPIVGSGSVTVSGSGVSVRVKFRPVYAVVFAEQGLSSGTDWSVTLNGSTNSSASQDVDFEEPNGSYAYRATNLSGWHASRYTGSAQVSGAPVQVDVNWTAVNYLMRFVESGLPNATAWAVTANGTTYRSMNSTIEFRLSNGTFAYNLSIVPGWQPAPGVGNLTVNGSGDLVEVNWTLVHYTVEFIESGLRGGLTGLTWSVSLNGTTNSSSTNTIGFLEKNGTFSFDVTPLAGWQASQYPRERDRRGRSHDGQPDLDASDLCRRFPRDRARLGHRLVDHRRGRVDGDGRPHAQLLRAERLVRLVDLSLGGVHHGLARDRRGPGRPPGDQRHVHASRVRVEFHRDRAPEPNDLERDDRGGPSQLRQCHHVVARTEWDLRVHARRGPGVDDGQFYRYRERPRDLGDLAHPLGALHLRRRDRRDRPPARRGLVGQRFLGGRRLVLDLDPAPDPTAQRYL